MKPRIGTIEFMVEGGVSPDGLMNRGFFFTLWNAKKEAKRHPYAEIWRVDSRKTKKEEWSLSPVFVHSAVPNKS